VVFALKGGYNVLEHPVYWEPPKDRMEGKKEEGSATRALKMGAERPTYRRASEKIT